MIDSVYYASRAETFKQFYAEGCTLEEIGTAFGISRERVRQVLAKQRVVRPETRIDPVRAMRICRSATSASSAARELGVELNALYRVLGELGVLPALQRLWRIRNPTRKWTRTKLVAHMQELGAALGRAPDADELNRSGLSCTTYQYHFGSLGAAQVAAGFAPRRQGQFADPEKHPHTARGRAPLKTCCRGHDQANPENVRVYDYSARGGSIVRVCIACEKLRYKSRRERQQ